MSDTRSARVRFKKVGNHDGPVFEGQEIVHPCASCGPLHLPASAVKPPPTQAEVYALLHSRMRAQGIEPGRIYHTRPEPAPSPPPRPAVPQRLVLPVVPGIDPAKLEIHTLRFGSHEWIRECGASLDAWCERHGLALTVWPEPPKEKYPMAKFAILDMLTAFLEGDREWMMFLDGDVFLHPSAPTPHFPELGFYMMKDQPSKAPGSFLQWCRERFDVDGRGWVYRNSGVWACDRASARIFMDLARPPYLAGWQEQHQVNFWLMQGAAAGLQVRDLPGEWNRWDFDKVAGWAFHLAGKKKELQLARIRAARLLPAKPEGFKRYR